jgi:hypothetical protein
MPSALAAAMCLRAAQHVTRGRSSVRAPRDAVAPPSAASAAILTGTITMQGLVAADTMPEILAWTRLEIENKDIC